MHACIHTCLTVARVQLNSLCHTSPLQATGNTDLIPWLTNYFYIYYPIVILLVCIATIFSIGSRLASIFGYQKFIGEDEFSVDYIDEGKTLMKRERRIRQRHLRDHGKKAVGTCMYCIVVELLLYM